MGARVARAIATVARSVSLTGRVVTVAGAVAWLLGWRLGWDELLFIAGGCFVVLVVALAFTLGRVDLDVDLELEPQRVVVGNQAVGRIVVRNSSSRRLWPVRLEVPVGSGAAAFAAPGLAPGESWNDIFIAPTVRRSIIPVGPVRTVRGDPLGLARRSVDWGDPIDLYVHPKTVRLAGLTAGWLRDLEGNPTKDLSPSDVAFHTLREYVPGDDRRHVHWRTSARLGTLMVRQFVDSRRSHLGLVLSTNPTDYADEEEFELAVSVVGSLGVSALVEDQQVTATTGGRPLPTHTPTALLDALSGVEATERSLALEDLVRRSIPLVRGASVVGLVTGSAVQSAGVRAACERFHHDVRVLGIRCRPEAEITLQTVGTTSLLELGALTDLARVMRSTVSR